MEIFGEMFVLSLIYVAVCTVRSVQYAVSLLFAPVCYLLITRLTFSNILCMFAFSFVFLFSILCILCLCIVLCTVSPFVYSWLFYHFCTNLPTAAAGWETNRI